ncbi:hypothetical protein QBC33DRAFT_554620 [Phialemonium atrogriseum]|uniref:Uncharacterized protein n=1 Tax=Phialemonium atrogriseum TaxID=1093897 RepID=A0AAJ0C8H8_9PEZI|nr:uncharacterized protein QBC33DRAFT_554620 [Phialemonium atrogriseum]KAK1771452.1 hypothetical protein QBC33DRAFT_554620 [Phialemonium atrogriseum]
MGGGGPPHEPVITGSSDRSPPTRAMSLVKRPHRRPDSEIRPAPPTRPSFHHQYTSDRLREGFQRPPPLSMASNIRKDRKSIFKELGLDAADDDDNNERGDTTTRAASSPAEGDHPRRASTPGPDSGGRAAAAAAPGINKSPDRRPWYARLAAGGGRRPRAKSVAGARPSPLRLVSGRSS